MNCVWLLLQMQKQEQQIKALSQQLEKALEENRELTAQKRTRADLREQIKRQQLQLMGAVRRIKWLLSQQQKVRPPVGGWVG